MSISREGVINQVKRYVLDEFLPGEDASLLKEDTPLISGGVLTSIKTMKLVTYLEETYNIEFEAHEVTADYLDTLGDIANIVMEKAEA